MTEAQKRIGKALLKWLLVAIAWRTLVGFISFIVLADRGSYGQMEQSMFWPIAGLLRWDSAWYLRIAVHGYESADPNWLSADPNFAFFPLYPLAIRWVATLLGLSGEWASIVVNTLSLTAVLYGLEQLVVAYNKAFKEKVNQNTVKILLLFGPSSIFFAEIYTEALFTALFVWFLYGLLTKKPVLTLLTGSLLAVTRLNGLICLGFAVCWLIWMAREHRKESKLLTWYAGLIVVSALPFLAWMLYNKQHSAFNNPFFFLEAQKWWWQRAQFHPNIFSNIWRATESSLFPLVARPAKFIGDGWEIQLFKDTSMLVAAYALLLAFYKKIPRSWWFIVFATLLVSSVSLNFMSASRLLLTQIPILFILETTARKYKVDQWLIAASASMFALQVVLSAIGSRVGV